MQTIGTDLLRQRICGEAEVGDRRVGAKHHSGKLTGVERRTAAKADDGLGVGKPADRARRLDLRLLRLAHDVGIGGDEEAGAPKRDGRALDNAERLQAGIGDEKDGRAFAGERAHLFAKAAEGTGSGDRARAVGDIVEGHADSVAGLAPTLHPCGERLWVRGVKRGLRRGESPPLTPPH